MTGFSTFVGMIKSGKSTFWIPILLGFLLGCSSPDSGQSNGRAKPKEDTLLFTRRNYSDLFLDSNAVNQFITSQQAYGTVKDQVRQFYENRSYQFAWISEGNLTPAASIFYNQWQSYMSDFGDSSVYDSHLDSLFLFAQDEEAQFLKDRNGMNSLEMRLTAAFFYRAEKEFGGKVKNPRELNWFIPRKKKNYQNLLDTLIAGSSQINVKEPINSYYVALKDKLKVYKALEKSGQWPTISQPAQKMNVGEHDSVIISIKKVLRLANDWSETDSSDAITATMVKALVHFQNRMGLPETGKPDAGTLKAMQVPLSVRIRQMMINMERLRWLPDTVAGNFLVVNIPEFKLHVFENGKPTYESNVVVGKEAGKTQIFRGSITQINLNPSWGVPPGIVKNEVLPGIKRNRNYLKKHDMEVYAGNTKLNPAKINWRRYKSQVPFTIRQRPGTKNPLGKIKFLFPNTFNIYLHDSPSKHLYEENKRAFSHGCIRVEKAVKLGEYLLRNNKDWTHERIVKILKTNKETGIRLNPGISVSLVYFTTWVNGKGELNFRQDLYHRDEELGRIVFGD